MKQFFTILLVLFGNSIVAQTVDKITFEGNKRTKESFLKGIIDVKEGSLIDSILLQKSITQLKLLPAVADASYKIMTPNEGMHQIIFSITENYTLIPSGNVYTTNNNEFAFRIGLAEFNLFGRGIGVGGFYQNDIYNSYNITVRAPYLFSRKWGLGISHQNITTLEPVFLQEGTADYRYSNISYEVLGLFQLNANHRFEAGINYFSEKYDYIEGATNPNIPTELDVKKRLYKFQYIYDAVDFHFFYVNGFKSIFNFQYVTSTNLVLPDFGIGWNDFIYYKRVGETGNFASRLRLGISNNSESPFAPFSVDNNLNIRGVGNEIDRGTAAIVLNAEFRKTLWEKNNLAVQGNVFVDSGSWRNPGGDFGDFADSQNLRVYPGAGIRIIHKTIFNAVFRIDYGYGITKDASNGVVFGIGQYF